MSSHKMKIAANERRRQIRNAVAAVRRFVITVAIAVAVAIAIAVAVAVALAVLSGCGGVAVAIGVAGDGDVAAGDADLEYYTDDAGDAGDSDVELEDDVEARCRGVLGLRCPPGLVCIDNPGDSCNPARGDRDCIGLCLEVDP